MTPRHHETFEPVTFVTSGHPAVYYVFDLLLHLDGDSPAGPLTEHKRVLRGSRRTRKYCAG
jgi:ATP-dependent DNA ligase